MRPTTNSVQGSTIRRGAAWLFAGRAGDQVLGFLFGVVLARLLAPEDFGLLLTIQVFTGLAGFVAGGGMGLALVRSRTTTKEDYDVVFTLQLLIGCAIYALFYTTAPLFSRWYDNPVYRDLLRLSALSFIFRPLINMPNAVLYRSMRYRAQAMVGLLTLIVTSVTSICLAFLQHGVWSLVWGGIAGAVTQCMLLISLTHWRPGFSLHVGRAKELAQYGVLVTSNDLVDYLRTHVNIFILSRNLGPQTVGLYNKGESLARMPFLFVSGSVYQVLFRAMAAEQDNLDKCRYLFNRSIALVAVYATPFYVGLIWLAEPLVRGVYGDKWAAASGPLFILVFAWPFWLLNNMSGAVAAALNRLGRELRIQISNLVFTASAVGLALPFGIDRVAWAMVAAAAFSCAFMFRLALETLRANWRDTLRALAPAVALNVILATVLMLADLAMPSSVIGHDLLHVLVLGTLGGLTYAAGLLFIPIPALATERARWRRLLRLAPTRQS